MPTPRNPSSEHRPLPVARALRQNGGDLQTWRKLRGLTQQQVADRAGVSRATVGRLEGGEGTPSLESLLRVMRALGVLGALHEALDPLASDIGRLRAGEALPQRVRPRDLTRVRDE